MTVVHTDNFIDLNIRSKQITTLHTLQFIYEIKFVNVENTWRDCFCFYKWARKTYWGRSGAGSWPGAVVTIVGGFKVCRIGKFGAGLEGMGRLEFDVILLGLKGLCVVLVLWWPEWDALLEGSGRRILFDPVDNSWNLGKNYNGFFRKLH